jgi:hypothetical protein
MDWPDKTWRVLALSTDKSSLYDPCELGPQVMTVTGIGWHGWIPGRESDFSLFCRVHTILTVLLSNGCFLTS